MLKVMERLYRVGRYRLIAMACLLAVGMWVLAGCRSSASAPTGTLAATSTDEPPTHIPTPANTRHAAFEGTSFDYEPSLAQIVTPALVPGYAASGFPSFPAYIKFDLVGYPAQHESQAPRLEVYSVEEYARLSPDFQNKAEQLKRLLAEKPADLSDAAEIPVPIFSDVIQFVHVQIAYLPFRSGDGLRFIAAYKQIYDSPITNSRIFYIFQGFSGDGQFYVIAVLPVFADILPDSEKNLSPEQQAQLVKNMDDFDAYVAEITQQLDQLTPGDFLPHLSLLDALVQSLAIR